MKKRKSIAKILAITTGSVFLLIVVSILALYFFFPKEKIKQLAIPYIEESLGRKVSLGDVGMSIYPVFGIKMNDVVIANTTRPDFSADPFLSLKQFRIGVNVLPLFAKHIEVSTLYLEQPSILIEVDQAGSLSIDDLAFMQENTSPTPAVEEEQKDTALPFSLTVENIVIKNGHVVYDDQKTKQKITLGTIDQEVKVAVDTALKDIVTTGILTITDITYQTKDLTKPLANISLAITHDAKLNLVDGSININQIKVSLQKVSLQASGMITQLNTTPELDLKIATEPLAVQDIIAEIPVELVPDIAKIKAQGILGLTVAVKGAVSQTGGPDVTGKLSLVQAKVQYQDLPKTVNDVNVDLDFTNSSLDIKKFDLKLGTDPVALKGTIKDFSDPTVDLELKAQVNLSGIKDVTPLPEGMTLAGNMRAEIQAKGKIDPAQPEKADIVGTIDLEHVVVATKDVAQPIKLNGTISVAAPQIKALTTAEIGSSSMKLDLAVRDYLGLVLNDDKKQQPPRTKVAFSLTSPRLDTKDILLASSDADANKQAAAPSTTTTQAANAPLLESPLLPGIDVEGNLVIEKLIYSGIELEKSNVSVQLLHDVLDVDVQSTLTEGTIAEKLHLDTRDLKNIVFKNNLHVANMKVDKLIKEYKKLLSTTEPLYKELQKLDEKVHGTITLRSEFAGNGGTLAAVEKNLVGMIDADIRDGKIEQGVIVEAVAGKMQKLLNIGDLEFKHLNVEMNIKDERVYFQDFSFDTNIGDWAIGGDVGFDASLNLSVANKLTKNTSTKILAAQDKGKNQLSNVLDNNKLGVAGALLDDVGLQADCEGRVTLIVGVKGTIEKPLPGSLAYGAGCGKKDTKTTVQEQVKQAAKEQVQKEAVKQLEKVVEQNNLGQANKPVEKGINQLKKRFGF